MKIIQIMPDFGLAGAERMCQCLTFELKKRGHDVTVISMYDYHSSITEELENNGIRIIYLGKKIGLDLSMIPAMAKVFRTIKPDVIHTHRNCPQYAVPAAVAARVRGRVHTLHSIADKENARLARMANGIFFRFNRLVPVALSALGQGSIVKEYRLDPDKIPVVFNGIDLTRCRVKKSYETDGTFRILHIGRFFEGKNHVGLVEAFGLFHREHPDSQLCLIGDGNKRDEIKTLVAQNGLSDHVKFLGIQDDVYEYLNSADVFVLPSHYEGLPITLIEAMGTGLPIVATAVGGVPDMLDETCAQLVDVDSKAVAEAFEKYYCDRDLRQVHGEKAGKMSVRFSAERMAESYEKIYLAQCEK